MSENQNQPAKKSETASVILGIIGFCVGIPLSYAFQPGLIRAKFTCGEYVTNLPQLIANILKKPDDLGVQIILTLVITCGVTGIIGAFIGKAIDK